MDITEIRIREIAPSTNSKNLKLKAYATVTFDNCFVVHNMKIIDGMRGLFIAMPSRRLKDGAHRDIAHPIESEFRQTLQDKIIEEYKKLN